MNWFFLSLLAPFIYAINVFLDKYLIEAKIPEYRGLPIFSAITAIPVVLVLFLLGFTNVDNLSDICLIILTGMFTIWAFSIYLEALIVEETSKVIILIQLVPLLVLIFSYFILGEGISLKQLIGFSLLLISSIIISIKKRKSSFKLSKGLIYVLIADVLWAVPYIIIKFTSSTISFSSLVMYESVGVILGGLLLLVFISKIRKSFLKTVKKIKKPTLGLVFLNESLFLGGKILTYLALTLGPTAMVSILGSTQIFFGIILGTTLTILIPKVFKEDLSKNGFTKKVLLGLAAFIGIILVS